MSRREEVLEGIIAKLLQNGEHSFTVWPTAVGISITWAIQTVIPLTDEERGTLRSIWEEL